MDGEGGQRGLQAFEPSFVDAENSQLCAASSVVRILYTNQRIVRWFGSWAMSKDVTPQSQRASYKVHAVSQY